ATGGIIDVKMREMDHDGKYHGMAQVDLIDARLMLRGPVPLAKGWSFNLGARRSHIDAWIGSVMSKDAGFRTAPVYYDWQAFAETKPTPRSTFRVGVYGADDRLAVVLKNAIASDPGIGNSFQASLRTARLQATYKNQITDRLNVYAMASVGLDRESSKVGAVSSVDMDYIPIIFRGDISYRLSNRLLLRAGPDIIVYRYDADVLSLSPPEPGEIEGSHANRPLLRYDKKGYFSSPAAFGELEWTPSSRAKILFGARADYFSLTERWDFSPRLNARYDLHTGKRRTSVRAGLGVYMEPPQITQAVPPFGTSSIRSNRAVHSSFGIEQLINDQVEVSVEAFHKQMDNLVVPARFEDGSNGFSNVGEGYVYGTETMVRWKPGGRFFGWAAYTISRSVRKTAPEQPAHIFDFDQTHNLTVLGSYDLGRGWRVGGKFRFTSGSPYTPCNGGMLNAAAGTYECIPGEINTRRLPPFHQLDVRLDKTWTMKDFRLSTYLDVQNVYNRANPEGVSYNYRYTTAQWQSGLPIVPSLGIRGEF
ncbi:MAG TPA: TonB-dependent receptor, partial [Polyangiaceae bacterium]|nr:TonB-dependent receptor [Polyangiaceae bacterium]